LSAWPAGRSETAALAADFFLAVAVAFILTALVATVSSDCLGFGVGGAAVGGFAAGVITALLRCEIFAPTRTKPRDKQEKAEATKERSFTRADRLHKSKRRQLVYLDASPNSIEIRFFL
jgi:hypothetical protein